MENNGSSPEKFTLIIEFDQQTMELKVDGPIHNRMLCYGMLKLAEKAVDEHHAKQVKQAFVPAINQDLISHLRKLR